MLDLHNVDFMNENTTSSLGKPFSLIAEKEKKISSEAKNISNISEDLFKTVNANLTMTSHRSS